MAAPKNDNNWMKQGFEMEWITPNKKNCVLPQKSEFVVALNEFKNY